MKTVYGYCRISTKKQSIERQERNILKAFPEAKIRKEAYTGTKIDRKVWNEIYNKAQNGDTIVFDSVSRMSRNAEDGLTVYMDLFNRGVNLVFLKEPYVNTETYKKALNSGIAKTGTNADFILEGVNKYLQALAKEQISMAFVQAQKEVDDLHERTAEGIETARRSGKQIGQKKGTKLTTKKSIVAKDRIRKMSKAFDGNMTDKEILDTMHIARNTYYKYKKELIDEINREH